VPRHRYIRATVPVFRVFLVRSRSSVVIIIVRIYNSIRPFEDEPARAHIFFAFTVRSFGYVASQYESDTATICIYPPADTDHGRCTVSFPSSHDDYDENAPVDAIHRDGEGKGREKRVLSRTVILLYTYIGAQKVPGKVKSNGGFGIRLHHAKYRPRLRPDNREDRVHMLQTTA